MLNLLKSDKKCNSNDKMENCRSLLLDLPKPLSVDIEFKNISFVVPNSHKREKKTILKCISGKFKSGELTAIMGPSGAGKSSLLNILTGFSIDGAEGELNIGGVNRILDGRDTTKLKSYKKLSCYILQDDRLNPLFTVLEMMTIATDLKLGNSLNAKAKLLVINDILDTLGLSGTINTRCGSLSGGQKKRLSIALELIDNPPVIFLDEPTTGLDSSSSTQCIEMLKNLALEGRTIVCTIHQPSASVFELFDQVYLLAEGQCVYSGASESTVDFLASVGLYCPKYHNPADYILEVANCEYGNLNEHLSEANKKSDWRKLEKSVSNSTPEINSSRLNISKMVVLIQPPSEFYKLFILLQRCAIQLYRDWTVTHLKLLLHLMVGLLLGLVYNRAGADGNRTFSNFGYLMISLVYLSYTSLMPAVVKFPHELPVLKKENFNNWYNLKTYYIAALITGIPIQILFSVVYCGASYFLTGQPFELHRFLMFLMICSLMTLISDALGNVIGTCFNAINGTFLGAIMTCGMLVFAGYLVLFSHMTTVMRFISNVSYMKFALQGLVRALYAYDRQPLICNVDYCHLRYPSFLLQELDMQGNYFWNDVYVLLGELIVIRLIAYYTLSRSMKRSS